MLTPNSTYGKFQPLLRDSCYVLRLEIGDSALVTTQWIYFLPSAKGSQNMLFIKVPVFANQTWLVVYKYKQANINKDWSTNDSHPADTKQRWGALCASANHLYFLFKTPVWNTFCFKCRMDTYSIQALRSTYTKHVWKGCQVVPIFCVILSWLEFAPVSMEKRKSYME